ncbi:MAG: IS110 family transposase [Bacteroidetes bacterium]|nr:IS110 family transposase [Bacteroidota bacterium]|tara:strand:- start:282 stop:1622 length:1341 start_codon:yes stop_codon:yes gene_type:complete
MKKKESKMKFNTGLPIYNPNSCGIDIGSTQYDVAIPDGNTGHIVQQFGTFTKDLEALVTWLLENGITTVAIESTGVYWINLYLKLQEVGIDPYLVNAKHVKNVTGRKRDDTDAIWLQKLHACGLLQKSFQPERNFHTLRTYVRQRNKLVQNASDCARRMQKALDLMNVKIHNVISDILGKTGMLLIEAILNGERSPEELLKLKDRRIKASDQDILDSLNGIWNDDYIFLLQQAYDQYNFLHKQIKQCDDKIEGILISLYAKVKHGDITGLNTKKKRRPTKNDFPFNARLLMQGIVGVDLCRVTGLSETTVVKLISEIGTDMSKWKSSNQFSAWMNLVPNTKITGGKVISSKMQRKKNYAGLALRMAASNMSKSKSPLGDFARRMKSRLGGKGAVVASAHKLARIIYYLIENQKEYDSSIMIEKQIVWKQKRIECLEKQLAKLKNAA